MYEERFETWEEIGENGEEVSQARRQCFWAGCFVEAGSTGCFAVFDEVDIWVLRVGLCQLSFPGPLYVE